LKVLSHRIGDLVVLLETVEWNDTIGLKGEICIVAEIYDSLPVDERVYFDYKVCTADGISIDVWEGEIKKLEDADKI